MTRLSRSLLLVGTLAVLGMTIAVSIPVRFYARRLAAEEAAAAALVKIADAQRAVRAAAGRTGYATDLISLTTPCPGEVQAPLQAADIPSEYKLVLRPAEQATSRGRDCHDRPLASDYYVSARPVGELAGAKAFAMTSRGRVYVFFDGIPPRESDMARGGLAVPFDTLETFRIP